MKLFELAAQGRTCPDCGAPLPAPSQSDAGATEASDHRCEGASSLEPGPQESQHIGDRPDSVETWDPAEQQNTPPSPPGDLFSDLQDQAAGSAPEPGEADPGPASAPELRENTAKSLRERGYVIEEDAHGVRISSISGARGGDSQLSPSDVVSMAAELGGGVQPAAKLQTCAKCEARTPPGEPNCQWCGEPFSSTAP